MTATSPLMDHLPTVVEELEAPLLRYATRIVGDPDRARDVVQDTFLRLHEKDPGLEGTSLRRWLFTVCRNRALDIRRRDGRLQPLDPAREGSVEPRGIEARAVAEVLDAVDRLPSRDKEVMSLRFREGRSYAEISAETGLSVSHVGVVLHHAVRKLRDHWHRPVAASLILLVGAWLLTRDQPAELRAFQPVSVPPAFVGAPVPTPPPEKEPILDEEPILEEEPILDEAPLPDEEPAPTEESMKRAAPPPSPAPGPSTVPRPPPSEWRPRLRSIDVADPWE